MMNERSSNQNGIGNRDRLSRHVDAALEHERRCADVRHAIAALTPFAPGCWLIAIGVVARESLVGRLILSFTPLVALLTTVVLIRAWRSGRKLVALYDPPQARARERTERTGPAP